MRNCAELSGKNWNTKEYRSSSPGEYASRKQPGTIRKNRISNKLQAKG
jgi:hypothetical protein